MFEGKIGDERMGCLCPALGVHVSVNLPYVSIAALGRKGEKERLQKRGCSQVKRIRGGSERICKCREHSNHAYTILLPALSQKGGGGGGNAHVAFS
ncbi:hypothetical protein POVWA2_050140 [Plasmodium ovale wallikeri]|uniref:Uncharacterized protein n=1 Tax=Plasmodium ovale wallikeri TaxID=864142 RepID=A0A1A8ZNY1_PLAOA|nr:hypothetical protein POVWA2_050140 [Plasmodium ovale wallikeri]